MADCWSVIPASNRSQEIDLTSKFVPIELVATNDHDLSILRDYAEFWKVPYTLHQDRDESHVTIVAGIPKDLDVQSTNCIIISPTKLDDARQIARHFGLAMTNSDSRVQMRIAPNESLSLNCNLYQFSGPNLDEALRNGSNVLLYKLRESDVHILSLSIVSEYNRLVYDGLDDRPSWRFRLITRMPFSYRFIPSAIRNKFFKAKKLVSGLTEEALHPVEFLRELFLATLAVASKNAIPIIKFWRGGKSYALAVTHDVETQLGLEDGASRLIEIEKELGIRSTWNVPSDRYPLSSQLLSSLGRSGEVGAHDTRHDGRLLLATGAGKLDRVRRCKARLELLSRSEVRGFRAPLLQHSRELVEKLGEAGYEYDSSVPSWEALSPTSFKPHGVGTVFPFLISGTIEIPVSMPQDHQLIRVGGLRVPQAVDQLLEVSRWIKIVGGACVLLVHPDYEFAEEDAQEEYSRLLRSFRSDPTCDIMTLGELARWWRLRQNAFIDGDGMIKISSGENDSRLGELEISLISGYDSDGFKMESSSGATVAKIPRSSGLKA